MRTSSYIIVFFIFLLCQLVVLSAFLLLRSMGHDAYGLLLPMAVFALMKYISIRLHYDSPKRAGRWVDCSKRMPPKNGWYFVRTVILNRHERLRYVAEYRKENDHLPWLVDGFKLPNADGLQWLDEEMRDYDSM